MDIEKAGVPTIAVHTDRFARLVKTVARTAGMPTLRQAFVPQPVVDRTSAELRAYIEGDDPVNGQSFARVIVEGLTRPLDHEDAGLSFDRSFDRLLEPATEDQLQELFRKNCWTDFLPIVLPTEERVERMLSGSSHAPDEVVGRLAPTRYREPWEFTVEKIAVNAVMAGALPEHLPVILAAMSSGIGARSSSTTSFASFLMVNGPIRDELKMNSGIGAMGPYNHANAAIGRAFALACQNLQGGSVPDETYMGSQGNPMSYSFCFAENEERSPWTPFHADRGFDPDASAVTGVRGGWYLLGGTGVRETWHETFTRTIRGCDGNQAPFVLLDPLAAQGFVRNGFTDKQALVEWLADASRGPAREYWDNQWTQTLVRPRAVAGIEPFATKLKAAPDELIRTFEPDQIHVAVVGGETQPCWRMFGAAHANTTSIDDWR